MVWFSLCIGAEGLKQRGNAVLLLPPESFACGLGGLGLPDTVEGRLGGTA